MKIKLYPYQQKSVDFIKSHPSAGLLLDMGLGKSIITLSAIVDLMMEAEIEKVLVVAPLKVAETTWSDEAEKWEHTNFLRVSRVLGDLKHRVAALEEKADIYVIGRDSFVWLVKYYKAKLPFDMLVIDELTSFKSSTSQRFKALRLVRSQFNRIVGLTGTPAPNGYIDLWAQIFCLDGGERLGKYKTRYIENYFSTVMAPMQHYVIRCNLRPGAKERIEEKISDICISMKAEDYLQMPPISYIPYRVELPSSVMKQYHEFEKEQVLGLDKDSISAANAAVLVGKLSQFCNGAIYHQDSAPDGTMLVTDIHAEKLKTLSEIIEAAQSPVLVFYQFKHDIGRIKQILPKGTKVREYSGEQDLRDWNAGKIDVLLAHPASTAYGLNMQKGGSVIVWFGTGWNAELYSQANARLYRQGQQKHVRVYQLICKGTVDERALMAVEGKIKQQDALMSAVKAIIDKAKR